MRDIRIVACPMLGECPSLTDHLAIRYVSRAEVRRGLRRLLSNVEGLFK